jgi:hypothetical protein
MDLSAIGQQFGLNEAQTRAALDALVPVVAAGARRQAATPAGLQEILKTALGGNHASTFEDANAVSYGNAEASGNDVLGQIFGSKDVSRGVAQQLSASSGIGAAILKQLLPIVASILMGQVAKKMTGGAAGRNGGSGGGGLGDILGDILGGGQKTQQAPSTGGSGGGLGDILKDVLGGGQAPQSDADPVDPAPRRAPGSGGSLEDILGDILNGGKGGVVVKQIPQDQMGDILKDIFGGGAAAPSPEATTRGRKTIDDITGGGSKTGNAADDLLNSVERSLRR